MAGSLAACGRSDEAQQESNHTKQSNSMAEPSQAAENNPAEGTGQGSTLIAYFSLYGNVDYPDDIDASTSASVVQDGGGRYGTTEYIATMIRDSAGGELHRIEVQKPYPDDFDKVTEQNHQEMEDGYLLPLKDSPLDVSGYDTVFVGYPVWAMEVPQAVLSFLKEYDLSGKTVIPFCTHDGYGAGSSYQTVKTESHAGNVLDGMAVEDGTDIADYIDADNKLAAERRRQMKFKMKIKIVIDLGMTILLLLLMAFQITGQEFHEWFGAGMLILFLAHNILNYIWYKNLLRGKYNIVRVLQAVINSAILISMLCLAYSGIVMSNYVFGFVSINGGVALARQIHMAASYWGFVLMGIHLGFHWGMVAGMAGKAAGHRKISKAVPWVSRVIALFIAGYGAACFYQAGIVSYLFLKQQFAFFDFNKQAFSVFLEYLAMMGLWVFVGYYFMKAAGRLNKCFKTEKMVS